MQIKTIMRCHYIAIGNAKITKLVIPSAGKDGKAVGTLMYSWWGYKVVQSLWKNILAISIKLHTPYDSASSLLHFYPGEMS